MSEIQEVKNDIREIKDDQKAVIAAVNDLRVLVAGQYVTKEEFQEHQKENTSAHRWFAGICVTICIFIIGLFYK